MAADSDRLEISITKLQWGLRGAQILCAFIAIACLAAVISFDNKTISSSIIDNIFIFFVALSIIMSAAIVGIPYSYSTYGKFKSLARALRVIRIEFVLTAIWAVLIFLPTIALSVELGLRNCDPDADTAAFERARSNNVTGDLFISGLRGNCRTARAGNAFGWFALAGWLGSLALIGKEWYQNRRQPLPKHDAHTDEVTMHTSSSKSSLDAGAGGANNPPQGENVQMQKIHTYATSSSQAPTQQPQTQFQQPQPPTQQPQPPIQQPQAPIQQPQTQYQQPQAPIQQPQTQYQQPQGPFPPQQGPFPPQQGPYPQPQGPFPPQQGPFPPQQGPFPQPQGPFPQSQGPYPQPQVPPNNANPQATSPNIEFPQPQFFPPSG